MDGNNRDDLELKVLRLRRQVQLEKSLDKVRMAGLSMIKSHELKNTNNFSEVSSELIEEVKEELNKGEIKEAEEILSDLTRNLVKINHHGQRASSIVKGMLDHSRTSSGEKTMTDINKLCDEYLRLAYHGMRAKDKSFNAKFETDFDKDLPKLLVIPQDIGRVILNIINNAFQSFKSELSDRQIKKSTNKRAMGLVEVSSRQNGDHIEIAISDNGPGIPDEIKEKIFQPFFTTKDTGQGTGLGLSLSYDIIKAHGGELKAQTKEGEGTTFIIQLKKSSKT